MRVGVWDRVFTSAPEHVHSLLVEHANALIPRHAFVPFGAGPRVCIGNHFAWMESQLVLATWLQRLRFEPVSREPPGYSGLFTLRPRNPIVMNVSARTRPQPSAALA